MKVEELEKEILDSRQKIEYFRTKMQELVSTKVLFLCILLFLEALCYLWLLCLYVDCRGVVQIVLER